MYKEPEEGSVYRHYKGGIYEVLAVARHTENDEVLVIYKSVSNGKCWARPLSMWEEQVDLYGKTISRFTLIASSLEEMDRKRLF